MYGFDTDGETGVCYQVGLKTGVLLTLKHGNLMPRYEVWLAVIAERPELNGSRATVEAWDAAKRRYEVRLKDGSSLQLEPQQIVLPIGARVVISAAGQGSTLGKVVGHDSEAEGGYCVSYVQQSTGELATLRLRRDDALLCS